jgi:hypothetical protein
MKLRTRSSAKVKDWVSAINAARRLPEGWCHPHRFGSFAPPRGLTEDGSTVQWFIDGQSAFDSIASSIEQAKSEVNFSTISLWFLQKIVLLAMSCKKYYIYCRYLLLTGGSAQNCTFDALSSVMGLPGLIFFWNQGQSKVYR